MTSLLFLGSAILSVWFLASLVMQLLARDQLRPVAANGAVGIGSWAVLHAGAYTLVATEVVVPGFILLWVGMTVWSGWIVSPGGARFMFAPIGLLTGYWVKGCPPPPVPRETYAFWGKTSWVVGMVSLGCGLLLVLTYLIVAGVARHGG